MNTDQLLTMSEAARLKGVALNVLKYHLKKPGAPRPVLIGVSKRPYFAADDVRTWTPAFMPKKRRPDVR